MGLSKTRFRFHVTSGLQLWLDFEEAALGRGVDPDLPPEELAAAAEDLGCSTSCRLRAAAESPRPAEAA